MGVFCVLCLTESFWFYVRFFCVFCAGVFLLFLPEIRKTTWKSMFPHRIYRISQKNSSIVDSSGSSISLASRLSHKKNCRPQMRACDMGQTSPPLLLAYLELRSGQYFLLIHALGKSSKPFCRVRRTAGTDRCESKSIFWRGCGEMKPFMPARLPTVTKPLRKGPKTESK